MQRIVRTIGDRFLGAPEDAGSEQIVRILERGSPRLRIRAVREMGRRAEVCSLDALRACLSDTVPGIRRSAAHVLGLSGDASVIPVLLDALERERTDEPVLALSVAAVRLGLPVREGWASVEKHAGRRVMTWYGPKELGEAVGFGRVEAARRWRLALSPWSEAEPDGIPVEQPSHIRQRLGDRVEADSRDVEAWEALGAQQHPDDHGLLLRGGGGRRPVESHARLHALGLHGDPRASRLLAQRLRWMGDDPGHGFQSRRAAGLALGRLGDPGLGRVLVRALEDEALEYEGRPGAGLGIQIPVRAALLYSIGELGSSAHIELLCRYLGNTSGSVFGGFYLPAMDALIKLGAVEEVSKWLDGPELVAANALGVLGALGDLASLRRYRHDPRPRVAAAAQAGLDSPSSRPG